MPYMQISSTCTDMVSQGMETVLLTTKSVNVARKDSHKTTGDHWRQAGPLYPLSDTGRPQETTGDRQGPPYPLRDTGRPQETTRDRQGPPYPLSNTGRPQETAGDRQKHHRLNVAAKVFHDLNQPGPCSLPISASTIYTLCLAQLSSFLSPNS